MQKITRKSTQVNEAFQFIVLDYLAVGHLFQWSWKQDSLHDELWIDTTIVILANFAAKKRGNDLVVVEVSVEQKEVTCVIFEVYHLANVVV
jgi:hypothetical protein